MEFKIKPERFNKFFPFHILINRELQIVSIGTSIQKICNIQLQSSFSDFFNLKSPDVIIRTFADFAGLEDQLILLEISQAPDTLLRGQFHALENEGCYLFIGIPRVSSLEKMNSIGLSMQDFALHDPIADMLHLYKAREIATEENKQLIESINEQREKYRELETNYRSIVEKTTHLIYRVNTEGFFTFVNRVTERLTGYTREELFKMHYMQLVHPDYVSKVYEFYTNQVINKLPNTYFEFPIVTKTNEQVWIGQSMQYRKSGKNGIELTALAIDVSIRKKAEQKLAYQEEKYRNIIATMNLGLIEKDLQHNIRYVNQSFCNLSGYEPKDVIGKNFLELFEGSPDLETVKNEIGKRESGQSGNYTAQIKTRNNESRFWMISGSPEYNDKGEMVGSVGIQLDITEQKRLEEELKSAKEKAEASSKAKELFLATMSHEIRTPLNAIVGITDLMHLHPEARSKEQLDILSFSAKNLLALITDILDVSKIEAGKLEINKNAIEIEQIINDIYNMFRPAFEEKKVKLLLNIADSVPKVILGDELRLSQVLNNLISNALKFTHSGSVTIIILGTPSAAGKIRLTFEIKDTGIGIKKGNLEKIFQAFEQADHKIARQFGGTGLGLNITKKLVELQGGEIWVDSKPNHGSVFSFYIDYEVLSQKEVLAKAKSAADMKAYSGGLERKVLIVEDNLVNQKVAASYIHHWGLKCDTANNGAEALNMLTKADYDILLIDLYMPVMDGFETIHRIRKNNSFKNIPIIALTASAETNLMKKAIAAGANRCLSKPFNAQELYGSIMDLSDVPKQKIPVNKKTTMNKSNTPEFKTINLKKLEEASLGSRQFMLEMLDIIGIQVPELLKESEALWMKGDYEMFWKIIHKVKNNMLQLGMDNLSTDLSFIEKHAQQKTKLKEVEIAFGRIKSAWKEAVAELEEAKTNLQPMQLA